MATKYTYIPPDFIRNNSDVDTIHERMIGNLPERFDISEGSVPWDLTRPTAIEQSRTKQLDWNEAIKIAFPQFAPGIYLDYHADRNGLVRKAAIASSGVLKITGTPGTIVAKGDMFATESLNGIDSVSFVTIAAYTIPEAGEILVDVVCAEAGTVGNTAAGSIVLLETDNPGIESVMNPYAFTNGADEENDDALRERVLFQERLGNESAVGNMADYISWASEVEEVGSVRVIPSDDGSGLVTLVITDRNGQPASADICQKVYNHILSPDEPALRKTTVNDVFLEVIAPTTASITFSATVEIDSGTIENIKAAFVLALNDYIVNASEDKEIRYTKVCNILGGITGVYDYKDALLNGGKENIVIGEDEFLVFDENSVTLTAGTV